MSRVPFEKEEVRSYLDGAIRAWREILKNKKHPHNSIAIYYCDAFQSVRVSIFGKSLPKEE